jgi:hypothetical protein
MIPMTKSMVTCGFGGVVKRACEYLLLLTRRLKVPYLQLHVECDRFDEHAFVKETKERKPSTWTKSNVQIIDFRRSRILPTNHHRVN